MRIPAVLLSCLLAATALQPCSAQARGFGGVGGAGRGFADGGRTWGGGGYHFQGGDWQRGYGGYHPMYGDGARPAWNNGNRDSFNRDSFNGNTINNNTFNRKLNVNNNFYNRDFNGWNSNWANHGYWNSRPWSTGWYGGWGGWGWWGGNAAAWGLAGLATGATITALVDASANRQSPIIVVPSTSYELNYGSVESVGSYGASFSYTVNGSQLIGAANCQQGLLNGQIPGTSDQAQLLNAVCQVAYGAGV